MVRQMNKPGMESFRDVGEAPIPLRRVFAIALRDGEGLARSSQGESVWGSELEVLDRYGSVGCYTFDRVHTSEALRLVNDIIQAYRVALPPLLYPHENGVVSWSAVLANGRRQRGFTREPIEAKPQEVAPHRKSNRNNRWHVRFDRAGRYYHNKKTRRKV